MLRVRVGVRDGRGPALAGLVDAADDLGGSLGRGRPAVQILQGHERDLDLAARLVEDEIVGGVRVEGQEGHHDSLVEEPGCVPAGHHRRFLRAPGRGDVTDHFGGDFAADGDGVLFFEGERGERDAAHGVPEKHGAVEDDPRGEVAPAHDVLGDGDAVCFGLEGAWG